jgi:hypothetical protein
MYVCILLFLPPKSNFKGPGEYGLYQLRQADGSCLIPNVTLTGEFGPIFENGTTVIAGDCIKNDAFFWLMKPQSPSSIEVSVNGDISHFCLDAGSHPA